MSPSSSSPDSGLASVLAVQRKAFEAEGAPSAAQRQADLTAVHDLVLENRKAIKKALGDDFGARSAYETEIADIATTLHTVRFARRHVGGWMKPRKRKTGIWFVPAANRVIPQPKGCVGIMVPFNFPVNLAVGPLSSALAAGNRVMLKMSELTPNIGELLARLVADRFPPEKVVVVNGGLELSQEFAALPLDHLLFTGSTAVGRHIMRAAAENLTPVTLELGGKSPVIVGEDYPLAWAAERIVWGKLLNAGQICIAPDYVLVPQGKEREFATYAQAAARKLYPKLAGNDDYTAVINDHHYQRLTDTVADARSKGAVIETAADPAESRAERKLPLTIVLDPTDDMRVMQDEIFGPVLPVRGYGSVDDAISFVNERRQPAGPVRVLQRAGHAGEGAGADDEWRRGDQRHPHALPPGRHALRRDRPQRDGRLPHRRGLRHVLPPQAGVQAARHRELHRRQAPLPALRPRHQRAAEAHAEDLSGPFDLCPRVKRGENPRVHTARNAPKGAASPGQGRCQSGQWRTEGSNIRPGGGLMRSLGLADLLVLLLFAVLVFDSRRLHALARSRGWSRRDSTSGPGIPDGSNPDQVGLSLRHIQMRHHIDWQDGGLGREGPEILPVDADDTPIGDDPPVEAATPVDAEPPEVEPTPAQPIPWKPFLPALPAAGAAGNWPQAETPALIPSASASASG